MVLRQTVVPYLKCPKYKLDIKSPVRFAHKKFLSFCSYKNNHSHDVWQRSLINTTEEWQTTWWAWRQNAQNSLNSASTFIQLETKSVSCIYKKKTAFHIIFIGFWRENKNSSEPFQSDSRAHTSTCAHGELTPSSAMIHRALRQNVQKLCVILNSAGPQHKQPRLLFPLRSIPPSSQLQLYIMNVRYSGATNRTEKQKKRKKKQKYISFAPILTLFFFYTHTKRKKHLDKELIIIFKRKQRDWNLDHLVCFAVIWWCGRKFWRMRKISVQGQWGGCRLQTGVGVISWPWQPLLNFAVAWLVSQIPFLHLRKGTTFYLLASESVKRQIQKKTSNNNKNRNHLCIIARAL